METDLGYEKSSGNVFKDLELADPELETLKAQLALSIIRIIRQQGLNQEEAAKVLGVDQPEISKLKNGKYSRFGVERLFNFINRLGKDVDIRLSEARGHLPHQRLMNCS